MWLACATLTTLHLMEPFGFKLDSIQLKPAGVLRVAGKGCRGLPLAGMWLRGGWLCRNAAVVSISG
jgi:hypothetical protein